uniref:Sushi domain-containing protein n=1 Tax=Angiostrongylus cantonensis TaxID=6313 RepID=A0A0K0D6H8_ANGCA
LQENITFANNRSRIQDEFSKKKRPKFLKVPMCDERRVNGRIYQCKRLANGNADFQKRDDTETPCDGHPYGSLWKEGSLQYACGKGGVKDLMGCVTSSDMFIPSGEAKLVDGAKIECKRYANGTARMHAIGRSNRRTCIGYMGKRVNEGSEWDAQLGRYRCGKGGVAVLLGCVTPAGELLPLGEVRRIDGLNMTCEKKDGGGVSARVLR